MHFIGESARLVWLLWSRWRLRFENLKWCAPAYIRAQLSPCVTCCPRVCLTQTKIDQYAASFELLHKLELKQQSPELAEALVLMAEVPELPEEPEKLAPETSQASVTTVSDAAYNKSLQTILQHLTSQEATYDANAAGEIAQIKRLLISGEKRPEALSTLLRWCCSADDDDALARMAFEAGADPNLGCEYLGPPLHVACTHVCPRIAKLLLAAQAHPNTMVPYLPKGKVGGAVKRTALDIAIATASPEMIQILLEAGADFNAVKIHGGVTYDAMQVHTAHSQHSTRPWLDQRPVARLYPLTYTGAASQNQLEH